MTNAIVNYGFYGPANRIAVVALVAPHSLAVTSMVQDFSNHRRKTCRKASISHVISEYTLLPAYIFTKGGGGFGGEYARKKDAGPSSRISPKSVEIYYFNIMQYIYPFYHPNSIHTNSKEYGFGQSILYDGQLVFHTPPYSLQPVSLQECYENFCKTNIRVSRHDAADQKSPLFHHQSHDTSTSSVSPIDKSDRPAYPKIMKQNGSPVTLDRKNRRHSHTTNNTRQNITPSPHEVPYSRLLDSPSNRAAIAKEMHDFKTSPILSPRPSDNDVRLLTPKSLRIPASKASASESKLTGDYFQGSEVSVR